MKQKAMETKLVVRPLVGCLTHTHFWEGPCRAGRREDMTEEAEAKAPITLAVGDTQQPIRNKQVFIGKHGLIAITAFADLEDVAG